MPFPVRIQPLDSQAFRESICNDSATKLVPKSRLKRLFDRKISSTEKPPASDQPHCADFEPSSVCLAKMVQNFIEDRDEKQQSAVKCSRNRCNCFNGNSNDGSDDEFDFAGGFSDSIPATSFADSLDLLKSLIPCASIAERNLLADASKIVERNKNCKRKDDLIIIVTDSLLLLNYDASICKSRWEKNISYPAGEYEYIDVILEGGERLMIDVDFRSEFEIARSTGGYRAILQALPSIFIGKSDRLQQIITIAAEAATQSLKKMGMHIAPWRKAEYMRAKWLSPYTRATAEDGARNGGVTVIPDPAEKPAASDSDWEGLELIFGEKTTLSSESVELSLPPPAKNSDGEKNFSSTATAWELPAIKPKKSERGSRGVTGLAFLLREKP